MTATRKTKKPVPTPLEIVCIPITRWFVYTLTDEGRLVTPMHRERYDYNDSETFDRDGYDSMELAQGAIVEHVLRVENEYFGMFGEPNLYSGETAKTTKSYLVISRCTVSVHRQVTPKEKP